MFLCVDVAHGHHSMMRDALKHLKEEYGGDTHIMAGNVATGQGSLDLASWGADSIRVGIGGGSICSTRLVSGHGVPTLQSIIDCVTAGCPVPIIADGGMKTSGDMLSRHWLLVLTLLCSAQCWLALTKHRDKIFDNR
jgi:IMP dehydrogenase